jgi:hypothetical protein
MVVVGVGVGYGMTVAFLLAIRLVRNHGLATGGSTATGAFAGLTPAMISLVTLGACCSTTAAATAGVGLVAQASGTTASNLLLNNWYLGVFQIVMVWVALLAQEMLLVVYAGLFGRPTTGEWSGVASSGRRVDGRFIAGAAVRILLLAAGVIWALAVLAEWTTVNPTSAGAGYWFQWIFQHWLLAALAIGAALFPTASRNALVRARSGLGWVMLTLVAVSGLSLLLWVPPPLPTWGVDALGNQVLGAVGGPASWGAIGPGAVGGVALYLRWALEYLLLGGFAIASVVRPQRIFAWLTDSATTRVSPPVAEADKGPHSEPRRAPVDSRTSSAPLAESP